MSRYQGAHELTAREWGMRALLFVQAKAKPERSLIDYVNLLVDRFGVGRATAYRVAREALDCLGITPAPYDQTARSTQRFASRTREPKQHSVGMLT